MIELKYSKQKRKLFICLLIFYALRFYKYFRFFSRHMLRINAICNTNSSIIPTNRNVVCPASPCVDESKRGLGNARRYTNGEHQTNKIQAATSLNEILLPDDEFKPPLPPRTYLRPRFSLSTQSGKQFKLSKSYFDLIAFVKEIIRSILYG